MKGTVIKQEPFLCIFDYVS